MAKGKYHTWMTQEALTVLRGWARNGLTDKTIADNMGITTSTLYEWKKKYPEISEALKKGKDIYDDEMEEALAIRGQGQWVEEVTTIVDEDSLGRMHKKIQTTKRYIPPDTTAIIFWLKNRRPEQWRDKRETDLSGQLDSTLRIEVDYGEDTN